MKNSSNQAHVFSSALNRGFLFFTILGLVLLAAVRSACALELDEIVARHTEALGGQSRLAALRSLRLVGKQSFGDGDFNIELVWTALFKRPGMLREEVTLQGLTAISAYDGKEGWQVQPFGGRKEPERSSVD